MKRWGVALTGGIATGKSTVARLIRGAGYRVIDADQLARLAVAPGTRGYSEVVRIFGEGLVQADGTIDRRQLARLVFTDHPARQKLENLLHPLIAKLLADDLHASGLVETPRIWFYEAALIYETGSADRFAETWVTCCPDEVQRARLSERTSCTAPEAEAMIASQMPNAEKAQRANLLIDTAIPLTDLANFTGYALVDLKKRLAEPSP